MIRTYISFYKDLQNYVDFVVKKRCENNFNGYYDAYEVKWDNKFSFSYNVDINYIYGLPVKSTNYEYMNVKMPLKKNFSTLPDKKEVIIIINTSYFNDYINSEKSFEEIGRMCGDNIYINF